jgi:ribonuclease J
MAKPKLRIIPLGGLGEIGKNMTVFEYDGDAIIVDAGIMFPANDMHGVDYIIPDFTYLHERENLFIRGVIYTHGHEDHIGAVNHFVEQFPGVPLYATRLTAGLLGVKLRNAKKFNEAHIAVDPDIHVVTSGERFKLGPFDIEPFRVTHSIPDCVGYAIQTPVGLIVYTGDYKFDNTPIDGRKPDYGRLASYGQRGVKLLMGDSTNADKEGWTPSESTISPALDKVFKQAKGRIMVATFASLISRVQQVANVTQKHGRKLVINGYTMREYVKLARELGYLDIPDSLLVDAGKINGIEPHKLVMMVTGSQGEPSAVLGKMAIGKHRYLDVQENDMIILSSHPIPGNEEMVYRTIDRLIARGADVVYHPLEDVHVSGHARREEMRLMLNLVKPKFVMPVHGEVRHLRQHRLLAEAAGVSPDCIIESENGVVVEMDRHVARRTNERVPADHVYVDGSGVGDVGRAVIRDREILARDGFMLISVNVDRETGLLMQDPEIISRGFVYLREAEELLENVRGRVIDVLGQNRNGTRREALEDSVGKLLYHETRRRPMIFTIINEV